MAVCRGVDGARLHCSIGCCPSECDPQCASPAKIQWGHFQALDYLRTYLDILPSPNPISTFEPFKKAHKRWVFGSKRAALTRSELPHGLLAANQPFSEFLHPPPPSSSHHSASIEGPIHLQLISTPTVNTITMVAIARSFGAARVAARGFSNAGMCRAYRSCSSHWF